MSGRNLLFVEEMASAINSMIPVEAQRLILKKLGREDVDSMDDDQLSHEVDMVFYTKAILELHQMVLESAHNNDVVID